MCRAELAWRLPPRLRRWRCVFPLDAGIGQTPHIMAKLASGAEPIRVIPNGDHYCACVLGAHAFELKQTGGELLDQGDDEPVEFSDLVVDVEDSAGEGLQGELGRDHRVSIADRVRPPGRTGTQALHAGEVADLVTHFLRCGNDGVVELLQGRAAALDCRLFASFAAPAGLPRCRNGLWPPGPGVLCAPPRPRKSHPRASSLPLALRLAGSGPVTSSTGIPESARCRVMPAP